MTRSGNIGERINLVVKFYESGALYDPYDVGDVRIYTAATGGDLLGTVTPTRDSTGIYTATWTIPSSMSPTTLYDSWTWTAESDMASVTQVYSFTIVPKSASVAPPSFVRATVGCRGKPTWDFYAGVRLVEDVGNGTGLRLSWGTATPNNDDNLVHYNIYYSTTRFGVFDSWPKAITTDRTVTVNVDPGKIYYFAVRATEFDPTEFNIAEMDQISNDVYAYPDAVTLLNDIDAYGAQLYVDDTSGYPEAGFLLVGTEVMLYSAKTSTYFIVEDIDRGAITTVIDEHEAGSEIKLWHGVEEQNTVIFRETAAWHNSYGTPRNTDEIGEFNVADDGYRENALDILTTDLAVSDANTIDFPSYDYNSYHRPSIQATMSGECVQSYVGGEFDGGRGLFLQDRNLARLDAMLQVTGEVLLLLKRKWTGRRCRCMGLRREHPRTRCPYCYGVGFDGGYDRYINTRPISEYSNNINGYILARVYPYTDDLELDSAQSLRQTVELTAWTLNVPTIKDRDVVIRFNEDGSEEFRYECLNVTRNKLFFGTTGKQEFTMKRMDKTDVLYQFSI